MNCSTNVVQVTNVSPSTTSEQMRTLFGFLGTIEELKLFPPDDSPLQVTSRVCFVKFREAESVGVSQHLTNTVFVDRALIVVPFAEGWCAIYLCVCVSVVNHSYLTPYCWESEASPKLTGWRESSAMFNFKAFQANSPAVPYFHFSPVSVLGCIGGASLSQCWTCAVPHQKPGPDKDKAT